MAKISGVIAYGISKETSPGIWETETTEVKFRGDLIKNVYSRKSSENLNDGVDISNEISFIADQFAYDNFHSIVYVKFMGSKWKVSSVTVDRPRLTLSIGGLYNG